MKKVLKSSFILIFFIWAVFCVNAQERDFQFLKFIEDINSQTNKVSFEVKISDKFEQGDKFSLEIYYNKNLLESNCIKELDLGGETLYTKFVCDVPKLGEGEYVFVGSILRGEEEILVEKDIAYEYLGNDVSAQMKFEIEEEKSVIIININGDRENVIVQNTIPKSVIEKLTEENREQLIESELDFEIIDEDPLIAWTVDKAPTSFNYTINKKIDEEDLSDFKVEIKENNNYMILFQIVFVVLILIIMWLVFRPMIKRKS